MTSRTSPVRTIATLAAGLTAAAALAVAAPAASSTPSSDVRASAPAAGDSGYVKGSRDDRLDATLRERLAKAADRKAAGQRSLAATSVIYYDASQAPSFATQISQAASIWNSSVSNVRLQPGSPADLTYYEGSDPSGSYYSGNGHGSGYILIDYSQAQQYDPLRIVAHETGHDLGLPDHYSGPCSELMSGGGPGPSCTNPYPNSTESAQVDSLWAYGFSASTFDQKAAFSR